MNDRIAESRSRHAQRVLWAEFAGGILAWVVLFGAVVWGLWWLFGVTT